MRNTSTLKSWKHLQNAEHSVRLMKVKTYQTNPQPFTAWEVYIRCPKGYHLFKGVITAHPKTPNYRLFEQAISLL